MISQDIVTDQNGEVLILLPEQENSFGYAIIVNTKDYVPYEGFYDENDLTPELTIRTPGMRTIGGIIKDPQGNPQEGVKVELTIRYDESHHGKTILRTMSQTYFAEATSDAEGRWEIPKVPIDQIEYRKYFPRPSVITQGYKDMAGPRRLFLTHPSFKTTPVVVELRELLPNADGKFEHVFTMEGKCEMRNEKEPGMERTRAIPGLC